jgi:hypothetical protein
MKILIKGDHICGAASNDYTGPDAFIVAPDDFDIERLDDYRVINGELVYPAADIVRNQRNAKLVESDWTQVLDAAVDQAAWAAYRQALRDIPQQEGFPATAVWPTQPV